MYNGEFEGENAKNRPVKILILGESHHWSNEDWTIGENETEAQAVERRKKKAEEYKTEDVVKCYFENYAKHSGRDKAYRFFDNIVRTFGVDPEQHREDFWSNVYFGNYIDELCGVRDSKATNLLKKEEKRKEINTQLFSFIENHKINIVFCFSRKVYSKLPPLKDGDREERGNIFNSHRLDKCVYCPGPRDNMSVSLSESVTVYGLKHPSQGFSYRRYQDRIAKIIQEEQIFFLKSIDAKQNSMK